MMTDDEVLTELASIAEAARNEARAVVRQWEEYLRSEAQEGNHFLPPAEQEEYLAAKRWLSELEERE